MQNKLLLFRVETKEDLKEHVLQHVLQQVLQHVLHRKPMKSGANISDGSELEL